LVVAPFDHEKLYAGLPPETLTFTEASANPKQVEAVGIAVTFKAEGSVIVAV
jgi:hypothetical protein